jgi:hypothetical protein
MSFLTEYKHIFVAVNFVCVMVLLYYLVYKPDSVLSGDISPDAYVDEEEGFTAFGTSNLAYKAQHGIDTFTGFNSNVLVKKAHPGLDTVEPFTGFNSNVLVKKAHPGLDTVEPFTSALLYRQASNLPVPKYMMSPLYGIPTINTNMLEQDARN